MESGREQYYHEVDMAASNLEKAKDNLSLEVTYLQEAEDSYSWATEALARAHYSLAQARKMYYLACDDVDGAFETYQRVAAGGENGKR